MQVGANPANSLSSTGSVEVRRLRPFTAQQDIRPSFTRSHAFYKLTKSLLKVKRKYQLTDSL
jgi:hypothetical protein